MTELIFKCRVMSHTEEQGEQQGQGEVGEEEQAVSDEEHVEDVLLHSDHGEQVC